MNNGVNSSITLLWNTGPFLPGWLCFGSYHLTCLCHPSSLLILVSTFMKLFLLIYSFFWLLHMSRQFHWSFCSCFLSFLIKFMFCLCLMSIPNGNTVPFSVSLVSYQPSYLLFKIQLKHIICLTCC